MESLITVSMASHVVILKGNVWNQFFILLQIHGTGSTTLRLSSKLQLLCLHFAR